MPAYSKEIIKENYVQELNPQIESFAGFEWGRKTDLSFLEKESQIRPLEECLECRINYYSPYLFCSLP